MPRLTINGTAVPRVLSARVVITHAVPAAPSLALARAGAFALLWLCHAPHHIALLPAALSSPEPLWRALPFLHGSPALHVLPHGLAQALNQLTPLQREAIGRELGRVREELRRERQTQAFEGQASGASFAVLPSASVWNAPHTPSPSARPGAGVVMPSVWNREEQAGYTNAPSRLAPLLAVVRRGQTPPEARQTPTVDFVLCVALTNAVVFAEWALSPMGAGRFRQVVLALQDRDGAVQQTWTMPRGYVHRFYERELPEQKGQRSGSGGQNRPRRSGAGGNKSRAFAGGAEPTENYEAVVIRATMLPNVDYDGTQLATVQAGEPSSRPAFDPAAFASPPNPLRQIAAVLGMDWPADTQEPAQTPQADLPQAVLPTLAQMAQTGLPATGPERAQALRDALGVVSPPLSAPAQSPAILPPVPVPAASPDVDTPEQADTLSDAPAPLAVSPPRQSLAQKIAKGKGRSGKPVWQTPASPTHSSKVKYGEYDLSKEAIAYRREQDYWGGKNLAVFEYETSAGARQTVIGMSEPGKHSEKVAWNELQALGVQPHQVKRVYSEREPCMLPGAFCGKFLAETFPNAEVYHSFSYGDRTSREAGNAEMRQALTEAKEAK